LRRKLRRPQSTPAEKMVRSAFGKMADKMAQNAADKLAEKTVEKKDKK
jgi:hypothetical protein